MRLCVVTMLGGIRRLFDVQFFQGGAYALLIEANGAEKDLAAAVEEVVGGVRFYAILQSRIVVVALALHTDEEREIVFFHVLIDHVRRVRAVEGNQFQSFVFEFGVQFLQVRKLLTASASTVEPEVDQ